MTNPRPGDIILVKRYGQAQATLLATWIRARVIEVATPKITVQLLEGGWNHQLDVVNDYDQGRAWK